MISSRIEGISFSGTMEIAAKIIELKSKGNDVIDLCVGEPDLPTPEYVKNAAINAIKENKTRYTLNTGIKELRTAIKEKFQKEYGANYSESEIIISNGAKQAVFNALQTIVENGDEVLIAKPFYVSYPHMVKLAGGIPVFIETQKSNNFKPTLSEIKSCLTAKSKVLIICNPDNPTGTIFTKNELNELMEFAYENKIFVLADEIYEKLIYNDAVFVSAASLGEKYKDNLIIINGVSKTYSMTGWRIGYAVAPKKIIEGMSKLQSHSTSNACTISQYASLAALTNSQDTVEAQRKIFEERRNFIKDSLLEIDDVSFIEPSGAFYYFIDISGIIDKHSSIKNSRDFCLQLLDMQNVAAVPGIEFGMENYIRISYAKSMEELKEAVIRIKKFILQLK
ncbi:MAG: pyridoxal phosphate-dependent aminotransferase [Ignavibacteriae bacterium]|nr:pyridoxal phosphate-dependent aminotransferase [Ignavibacteriota bacterium]